MSNPIVVDSDYDGMMREEERILFQKSGIKEMEVNDVEKLLANELNHMSFEGRERLLEEIHGVVKKQHRVDSIEEENLLLQQFQDELDELERKAQADPDLKHSAYLKATRLKSGWIYDRQLRWSFLNRENFDPTGAARCMFRYFDLIYSAFHKNDEVLMRPVCVRDIDPAARKCLDANGPLQILPTRDPSGRRIFVRLRDMDVDTDSEIQVCTFFAQCLTEDRSGTVCVSFLHNSSQETLRIESLLAMREMTSTLPFKFDAFHMCLPDKPFYSLFGGIITLYFGRENRIRRRLHIGSYNECRYSLRNFGISTDRLPDNLDSWRCTHNRDMKDFRKWLALRIFKDSTIIAAFKEKDNNPGALMEAVHRARSEYIECPNHEDCLFGKGPSVMKHPGNVAMRHLVEKRYEYWDFVSKRRKRQVAEEIVREIKAGGGRFLREQSIDENTSEDTSIAVLKEVDSEIAIRKVMVAFFNLKKKRSLLAKKSEEGMLSHTPSSSEETPRNSVGSTLNDTEVLRKRQINESKNLIGSRLDELCSPKNRRLLPQSGTSIQKKKSHNCTLDCFCDFAW
eukprot:CAMPEP_0172386780 /NCGR_PEP_ID=MMETSP1061-20121228/4238_1 /TAXON_ID=37318 /ORGANISM="Pseudo-nitzschia pungens, Strain cf. pungens" /LENGTH=566 /DNA_ID=CAMNT_0013116249 /DNA_START=89 /DNA_END=1789 /DNA_ORIENTATION=-